MVESLLFIGAGAGAGEKNTRSRSRSKMNRLRNTGVVLAFVRTGKIFWMLSLSNWLPMLKYIQKLM